MWHVETEIDYQPDDSGAGAGAGIEWYGGLQEKKLTFEEWNDASNHGHIKDKPTLPTVLKIPRDLQEGKRLLKLQRCKNGGKNGGKKGGAATWSADGIRRPVHCRVPWSADGKRRRSTQRKF